MKFVFLLLLSCFISLSFASFCGPWDAIALNDIPPVKPDDVIEVRYLVAPLLYCSYLNVLPGLGGYHGGIGFRNTRTGESITINYDAFPELMNGIFPEIIVYQNGTKDLSFENYGRSFIYLGINETYWHNQNLVVAHMSGSQYTSYMKNFIGRSNQTFPYYNLWKVYNSWPGKLLLDNFECFNFVWECFEQVQKYGGVMIPNLKVNTSFAVLFSGSTPKKVDYSDPVVKENVVEFFEFFEAKYNELGVLGVILNLGKLILEGSFYIRDSNDYYYVQVHSPFIELKYVETPLPYLGR